MPARFVLIRRGLQPVMRFSSLHFSIMSAVLLGGCAAVVVSAVRGEGITLAAVAVVAA